MGDKISGSYELKDGKDISIMKKKKTASNLKRFLFFMKSKTNDYPKATLSKPTTLTSPNVFT